MGWEITLGLKKWGPEIFEFWKTPWLLKTWGLEIFESVKPPGPLKGGIGEFFEIIFASLFQRRFSGRLSRERSDSGWVGKTPWLLKRWELEFFEFWKTPWPPKRGDWRIFRNNLCFAFSAKV
jgi:hypothetical protein